METRTILLPLLISIIVAISITYLAIIYLPLIITSVFLLIIAVILFSVIFTVTLFVMRLVLLPYYALRQVKPNEEESKGGYRLEEVKRAKSESQKMRQDLDLENKFCPKCGNEIQQDNKFCSNCGEKTLYHVRR